MPIRNYTSSVPAERSIAAIENKIVAFGARNISKNFHERRVCALMFDLPFGDEWIHIKLPGNVDNAFEVLRRAKPPKTSAQRDNLREQAERTAWKLMLDWVDLQMAMIELDQVKPLQVFMPYMWNGQQTLFEIAESTGFKQLQLGAP